MRVYYSSVVEGGALEVYALDIYLEGLDSFLHVYFYQYLEIKSHKRMRNPLRKFAIQERAQIRGFVWGKEKPKMTIVREEIKNVNIRLLDIILCKTKFNRSTREECSILDQFFKALYT
jgi:hypothetical protein